MEGFLILEVFSFLLVKSGEDFSEVEVLVFFVTIKLVQVNIFWKVVKDFSWVGSIGLGISFWD